jgi:serine/threonine protein kinase
MIVSQIGRYEIKGEISRGGMSTVFHAYDPRFDRDVAIKVLPREFVHTPQFRARFEREARTIALLEHPAIVPVYDFGEEEGQPYIVMRYMAGGSLADRLNEGPMSLFEVVKMISRLAPALDAAHIKGVIHRDLKPGNILFDQYGNAFLSDFGIARLAQTKGPTLTGEVILGTPAYMSPERIQGEKQEIGSRSDTYALGVIVYHVLTGEVPYDSDNPAKIMMMHILEPVPNILDVSPDLPPAFDAVIKKTMAKNPDDRYDTAGEFSLALEEAAREAPDYKIEAEEIAQEATPPAKGRKPSTLVFTRTESKLWKSVTGQVETASATTRDFLRKLPNWGWYIGGAVVVTILGALVIAGGPWLAASAANTPTPTSDFTQTPAVVETTEESVVVIPPSETVTPTIIPPTPTITPTPLPPPPELGGADQIAFISENDVWVSNVDGTNLQQVTEDGEGKRNLQWSPDGRAVIYIIGECVYSADVTNSRVDEIVCLEGVVNFEAFEISPSGEQVAVSLDHEELYIVPYDLQALGGVNSPNDLVALAECEYFAPLTSDISPIAVLWSVDEEGLALTYFDPGQEAQREAIGVVDISQCVSNPRIIGELPYTLFLITMRGYYNNPSIPSFTWDSEELFPLNSFIRNNGFGDLHLFEMSTSTGEIINPVESSCCYRDPEISPDGLHMIFAYQSELDDQIVLYYIPIEEIEAGGSFEPIPLPTSLFTNPAEHPQPALRPAGPGR